MKEIGIPFVLCYAITYLTGVLLASGWLFILEDQIPFADYAMAGAFLTFLPTAIYSVVLSSVLCQLSRFRFGMLSALATSLAFTSVLGILIHSLLFRSLRVGPWDLPQIVSAYIAGTAGCIATWIYLQHKQLGQPAPGEVRETSSRPSG